MATRAMPCFLIVSSFAASLRIQSSMSSSFFRYSGLVPDLSWEGLILGQAFDVVVDDLLSCVHCFDAMGV